MGRFEPQGGEHGGEHSGGRQVTRQEVEAFTAHLCALLGTDRSRTAARELADWLGSTGLPGTLLLACHTATAVAAATVARSVPMAELGGAMPIADAPLLLLLDGAADAESLVQAALRARDAKPSPDDLAFLQDTERAVFSLLYLLQCLAAVRAAVGETP
ncbi:hypothetical protein P3T37_006176 [Kitasatospora sp. MAA4]|uniref:hypothetical protein n=1 Tax=Kitasatospora sp. MAA4 TaxID=3035093 RepID=UPI0024747291|nr:hypothetical protein [Kitasatospora sp. MAA4]MDH6136745.1 hypothetical protein [Kitasatospora sp. MAA4]